SRWLYNQGSSTATASHPGDLGYFIGYRIAEAYYAKQTDKRAALRDIIEMSNADDFLARSGYAP
ncbi:MAG: lytic murein transglycosylase, partial [bacterium]